VSWRPEDLERDWKWWAASSPDERKLYSSITMRIQEALLRLEKESKQSNKSAAQSQPQPAKSYSGT